MRLPFPERISFKTLFYFAATLCGIQLFQGTESTFALCCFFYVLTAGIAFNFGGGLSRTPGAYIFFNSILSLILGVSYKAFLGEAADSNLQNPLLTIYVYLAGMVMMLVAVYLSRRVTPRNALLGDILPDYKMQTATVGCLFVGSVIVVLGLVAPGGNGSVAAALNQINHFFPLTIILGVIHTIRRSGGRRCMNLPALLCCIFMFINGVIGFSKEGMFGPIICFILAAASQRYRVSRIQVAGTILVAFFVFRYLVPYSQYGRIFRQESLGQNVSVSLSLLSNLGEVRDQYLNSSTESFETEMYAYYDKPEGLFDRLQMVSIDDSLIDHTEKFGTYGLFPIVVGFENIVPHFLWRDKPSMLPGNVYAHEVGLLGPEDDSTGVSFSATATAFHLAGWRGIFFLAPVLWFVLFFVYDWLCGDVRKAPWGLIMLLAFAHAGPEGDVNSIIYMFSTGAFGIALVSILAAYLMPIIGTLFIGPEGVFLKRIAPVRGVRRQLVPVRASKS